MNIGIIAKTVGTIVTKVARIGATQTAIQNLQKTNRKDMNEISSGDFKPDLRIVTKEDLKRAVPNKGNIKGGLKNIGLGSAKIMKVGAQTQVLHSLNEMNKDEMRDLDGRMRRAYKYNVSPKLQNIKKIKVGRD